MALASNPKADNSKLADSNDKPQIVDQLATITILTDSTGGSATNTLDDTTLSVKDDLASLAAKINEILDVLSKHGLIADA